MAGYESRIICGRHPLTHEPIIVTVNDNGAILVDTSVAHPMQSVCGAVAVAGDNTIIVAPPVGQRIVVSSFVIQNETAVATTMLLRDGAVVNHFRCLGQNQGDGLALTFCAGREWRLSSGQALVYNLSGANQCNYSVMYWVEAV
jgi:hypothetical protein